MQNIPGLSFFDGLTRSRAGQQGAGGRTSSVHSAGSPTETPLRDATPFASLRGTRVSESLGSGSSAGVSHPLGLGGEGEGEEGGSLLDDPLSTTTTSSLPSASFSRRAATISSGTSSSASSSPSPGLPSRRLTSSSTSSRSSILSRDSIFSSPLLGGGRRASSLAEGNVTAADTAGRERSGSLIQSNSSSKESEEPTAKDVTLMAQGTQAYAMLKRIQEHPIELADIIRLLVTKKAILILPTCAVSTDEPTPSRPTYEDNVIIPESNYGESLFVTLSGIRGVLKPASSSITLLGLATGQDFGTLASDATGPTKRSFFDNISKAAGPDGSATAELTSGRISEETAKELKLVNSSKRPVTILVQSVGSIHALLVDGIIPRPEGDAAPTPLVPLATGIATVRDRASARRTASSASSVFDDSLSNSKGLTPLPKVPKIASDLPLEWDNVIRDLESFVGKLKKSPYNNTDRYANEFQRKYDDVRHRFEVYGTASGMKHRWSDQDFDEVQQYIEAWLCREMYPTLFPHSPLGINSQDYLKDEQLQAKIAALNFLNMTLEHLGFVLEHPEDVEHIAQVVRDGGIEMQKLASVKSPSDKMNVILSSHRVVVDALNREPAVQELLVEVEEAKKEASRNDETKDAITPVKATETNATGAMSEATPTLTTKLARKRLSIPKIPMDGVIPRMDSSSSITGARSPKIPMDEGYDKPFEEELEKELEVATASRDTTGDKEENESTEKEVVAKIEIAEEKPTTEDNMGLPSVEVNPTDVALPTSPAPEASTTPTTLVPPKATHKSTAASISSTSSTATSSKKQYSADVLLPLLIFSVVKSNPPMLISNLRYIQRFKVQDHLTGELAYCLTNMMAVVSFLETLDPKALGLSSDIRVVSDMSDIQMLPEKPNPATPILNFQEGLDQTKALGHKVSQEIVGVAEEGIKVISDVVQDGYSKFFNRLLTAADGFGNNSNGNRAGSSSGGFGGLGSSRGTRSMSAASSLAATVAASSAAATTAKMEEEKKRKVALATAGGATGGGLSGMVSPAGVTSNVTTLSVDGMPSAVEKSSPHDSAMEHAAKNRVLEVVRTSEGPQLEFMACSDADDLRLSDVKKLLADYQRIGKILEEMKQLT
ncbi:hypothetical protein EDD11_001692 [Mortierella claussenii]|nr:hypothetical protein EDD11_001692 [Mortierella claussenii]